MTISPSELPTNIKEHEVYCPKCKKYSMTDKPAPVCEDCFGTKLITVIRSLITGQRMGEEPLIFASANTVKDELAP